jgi:transposase
MGKSKGKYTAVEKVVLLKRHLVDGEEVSKICEEAHIHPSAFYHWQEKLFENGMKAFESEAKQEESILRSRIEQLEGKLIKKDEVLGELMQEHLALKKSLGEI